MSVYFECMVYIRRVQIQGEGIGQVSEGLASKFKQPKNGFWVCSQGLRRCNQCNTACLWMNNGLHGPLLIRPLICSDDRRWLIIRSFHCSNAQMLVVAPYVGERDPNSLALPNAQGHWMVEKRSDRLTAQLNRHSSRFTITKPPETHP